MTVLYRMGDMVESEASVVGIANRTTDSAPGGQERPHRGREGSFCSSEKGLQLARAKHRGSLESYGSTCRLRQTPEDRFGNVHEKHE